MALSSSHDGHEPHGLSMNGDEWLATGGLLGARPCQSGRQKKVGRFRWRLFQLILFVPPLGTSKLSTRTAQNQQQQQLNFAYLTCILLPLLPFPMAVMSKSPLTLIESTGYS